MKKVTVLFFLFINISFFSYVYSQNNTDLFGSNMYIFSPTDDMDMIRNTINTIHDEMLHDEFSTKRYAFYFKPGDYTQAGTLNIAYYTHIGGLGGLPYDVKISNVNTPAPLPNNNATCTFWRSAENFTVAGASGDDINTWFQWAVSQAAPLRRINSEKRAHFQWYGEGFCSGGYAGDSYFADRAGSWSQQQFYFRNDYIEKGSDGYSAGGWNLAYQGIEFGAGVNMANHSDNWTRTNGQWNNVSRIDKTPIIREKPFLFVGDDDRYKIFRPTIRTESKGTSWKTDDMGAGDILDLENEFYVVKPGTSAQTMNQQLQAGKNLFITPGIYEMSEPLLVNRSNTIILGTGYATLVPSAANTNSAIIVGDVGGVTIASLLFDAHYNSRTLLQVGTPGSTNNHSANPTLLADLFFRVGGFRPENVNVDIALEINSSDVIGDHFWIWRADHGQGVGWFKNTSKNGLVVNGDNITIYGLFNEHFQEYGTLWNGEKGRVYFYQYESPYDVIRQSDFMSHEGTVNGYAAYKVADNVGYHEAYMMGIYDVLIHTQGAKIAIDNSIEVPDSKGVKIHNACNVRVSANNMGGYKSIINGMVSSTYYVNGVGSRFFIVDFVGTQEPGTISGYPNLTTDKNISSIYFDSQSENLNISLKDKSFNTIGIYDLAGRVLYSKNIDLSESEISINLSNFHSGIYIVELIGDNKTESYKISK